MTRTAKAYASTASLSQSHARVTRSVGETVQQIARNLCLSDAEMAIALDVTPRTLERWRTNEAIPQREARQRLGQLAVLGDHVRETFEDHAVRDWLESENRYLGGLTPLQALRAGRPDRVEAALEVIDSGIYL